MKRKARGTVGGDGLLVIALLVGFFVIWLIINWQCSVPSSFGRRASRRVGPFGPDAFEKCGGRFVGWVLRDELSDEGILKNSLAHTLSRNLLFQY